MDFKYKTDKSWGMVGLKRATTTVSGKFFGSDVKTNNIIVLTIKQAEKARSLNRDFVSGRETIAEIILTPNQFAEMITLMNYGDGVPCTIRFTQKDGFVEFKPEENKLDLILEERKKHIDSTFNGLVDTMTTIQQLIENKKISKSVGSDLVIKLSNVIQEIEGKGRDFINNQARLEIEKMVTEAKQNIENYIDYKIYETGLTAIKEMGNNLIEIKEEKE